MKTKVYAVYGFTGEYDDYEAWVVCVYPTEESAGMRCNALNRLARKLRVSGDSAIKAKGSFTSWHKRVDAACKTIAEKEDGDPRCQISYNGVQYYVVPLDADL